MLKKIAWLLFACLAIIIGLYPSLYLFIDRSFGLLNTKPTELLSNIVWNICFYTHISFGALALLIGWIQFNEKRRKKSPKLHRAIGKVYIISVLLSVLASFYIAYFATGGVISSLGFLSLGIIWLFTTTMAFLEAKNNRFERHKKWMIYSYAACFAAVTLRIWLPILTLAFGDFIPAYRAVAWLCWVPNIIIAFIISNTIPPPTQVKATEQIN